MLYNLLKENETLVDTLIDKGVVPVDVKQKIRVYDEYRNVVRSTSRNEALKIVSEKYRCCDRTVRRTVDWMEK